MDKIRHTTKNTTNIAKKFIKEKGSKLLYASKILPCFSTYNILKSNTKIIAYHTVNPKHFKAQMEYLKKHYEVVSLQKALADLNKKQVVITFDDGYKNNLLYAYPVLKRLGLKATIYVTYDFIDQNYFAWWDRIEHSRKEADFAYLKSLSPDILEKEVIALTGLRKTSKKPKKYDFLSWNNLKKISSVFEIGSHTITHPILTNTTLKHAKDEIYRSRKLISKKLGTDVLSFAYPNGNTNKKISSFVRLAGYNNAVIYSKGNNTKASDIYELRRRGINVGDDISIFAVKLAGLF